MLIRREFSGTWDTKPKKIVTSCMPVEQDPFAADRARLSLQQLGWPQPVALRTEADALSHVPKAARYMSRHPCCAVPPGTKSISLLGEILRSLFVWLRGSADRAVRRAPERLPWLDSSPGISISRSRLSRCKRSPV